MEHELVRAGIARAAAVEAAQCARADARAARVEAARRQLLAAPGALRLHASTFLYILRFCIAAGALPLLSVPHNPRRPAVIPLEHRWQPPQHCCHCHCHCHCCCHLAVGFLPLLSLRHSALFSLAVLIVHACSTSPHPGYCPRPTQAVLVKLVKLVKQ
eukprot:357099-Chlamydomonas_euryale.AAC.1